MSVLQIFFIFVVKSGEIAYYIIGISEVNLLFYDL